MAHFAVIVDNVVLTLVEAENAQIAMEVTNKLCVESVEGNRAFVGLAYDRETGIFEQPPTPILEKDLQYKVFEKDL